MKWSKIKRRWMRICCDISSCNSFSSVYGSSRRRRRREKERERQL